MKAVDAVIGQRIVRREGLYEVAEGEFVPADVIQCLLASAILVHLPWRELVEAMAIHGPEPGARAVCPGLGEKLCSRTVGAARRFAAEVERTIRRRLCVGIGLLVPLQVIPSRKENAAEAVEEG